MVRLPTILLGLSLLGGCGTTQSQPDSATRHRHASAEHLLHDDTVYATETSDQTAHAWLLANAPAYHLDADNLILRSRHQGQVGHYFRYQQHHQGHPVFGGQVVLHVMGSRGSFHVQDINLNHLQIHGFAPPTDALDADQAVLLASADIGHQGATRVETTAVLGLSVEHGWVWRVQLASNAPLGDWRMWIDATSGAVLAHSNELLNVDGDGFVFDPNPVASSGNTALDDMGDAITADLTAERVAVVLPRLDGTGDLRGDWVDAQPDNASQRANEPSLTFDYERDDTAFEEVMAYFHLDRAQDRITNTLGVVGANDGQQLIVVDGTNQDNSWFSTFANDITMGTGGVDDAEDADILLHEYGHAIQHAQVPGWGGGDEGSMGEGFGDYLAASFADTFTTQLADRLCVGNWDAVSYSSTTPPCLRRVDEVKHYPETEQGEVHADGEFWSASLWSSREEAAIGADVMDTLIFEHHFLMTDREDFWDASAYLAVADDNLYGGVHRDLIRRQMIDHGMSRELSPPPNLNVLQTEYVDITHPTSGNEYASDLDDSQYYTYPGAQGLRVHFDVLETEEHNSCIDNICDNIYLTNGDGDLFQVLGGFLGDTMSVQIAGDTVRIRLVTDESVRELGYHVDYIEILGAPPPLETADTAIDLPTGDTGAPIVDVQTADTAIDLPTGDTGAPIVDVQTAETGDTGLIGTDTGSIHSDTGVSTADTGAAGTTGTTQGTTTTTPGTTTTQGTTETPRDGPVNTSLVGDETDEKLAGCGCDQAPGPGGLWLGGLLILGLRRRR
ncbi:MAG: hypothetical protein GWP91_00900 [Rhodobacterales bacterium]|nr:hypothetical protein [Rhodobacterales bacterium]